LTVILLLLPLLVSSCRLDGRLHGSWKKQRQPGAHPAADLRPPIEYDDLVISATSISEVGECYEKTGDSYIFGLKRMARAECYRCFTFILRTPNVIQAAHQIEDLCFATIEEARRTCFDSARIAPNEGEFWFKSEARTVTACPLEGKFDVGYTLKSSELRCDLGQGTTVETCERVSQANFKFRNCSFPAFDMSLSCLGSWPGLNDDEFVVFENLESQEFRCGLLKRQKDSTVSIGFSVDSSCAQLSSLPVGTQAPEVYTFRPVIRNHFFAPCTFPEWLLGEYTTLSISHDLLEYSQSAGDSVPIVSRCVSVNGERMMVYSETKCGDALGFHCLWFRARSPSMIEFRTTLPQDSHNATICEDDSQFSDYPWSSASVRGPQPAACGIQGTFSTPSDLRHADCYNLTVDCSRNSRLQLTAFHCSSGVVFDSRSYDCLAAWRERDQLFTYAQQRGRGAKGNICFISQHHSSRLMIAATGELCPRDYSFNDHSDRTIVMEEHADCSPPTSSPSRPALVKTTPKRTRPVSFNRFPTTLSSTTTISTTAAPPMTVYYTSTSTKMPARTTPLLGTHWKWEESSGASKTDDMGEPHGLIDTMNSSNLLGMLSVILMQLAI
ncbi:hypothetical protein PFISCL1PPCAC_4483, partial [Pristionchus fissidentatus]